MVWFLAIGGGIFEPVALAGDGDGVGMAPKLSRTAKAGGTSWSSLPQSSVGLLLVMTVERDSQRRMMTFEEVFAGVPGQSLRSMSSMMSRPG